MTAFVQLPPGHEARVLDVARRELADIPVCAAADYRIHWVQGLPHVMIVFGLPELFAKPTLCIRITTEPSRTLIVGDKLRAWIRRSVEEYLAKNGIPIAA